MVCLFSVTVFTFLEWLYLDTHLWRLGMSEALQTCVVVNCPLNRGGFFSAIGTRVTLAVVPSQETMGVV